MNTSAPSFDTVNIYISELTGTDPGRQEEHEIFNVSIDVSTAVPHQARARIVLQIIFYE